MMISMNPSTGIRTPDDQVRGDWQRPDIATPADPCGGFKLNPEFEISGSIDNGNIWSSTDGNRRNRFTS
jgi:hypothetical protein